MSKTRVKVDNHSSAKEKKDEEETVQCDSSSCTHTHRRSKSLSAKNSNLPRDKDSYCTTKNIVESSNLQEQRLSTKSCKASPIHRKFFDMAKDDSSNHRVSLEKDIEQLQSRLQQERCMRLVLEKAMGRASSTLSPGHHHFAAQTKELLAEIELLEEEVAKREQHVLSLYRSIFQNCVSQTTSEHCSLDASPAHSKSSSTKQPKVISSAFCSSKIFRFRKFHSLSASATNDSRIKSSVQQQQRKTVFHKDKVHISRYCSDSVKAPLTSKTSAPRTLKEHLHRCPSKITEEMVRCMAAVYCCIQSTTSSDKTHKTVSSLPKTSLNSVISGCFVGEDKEWSTRSKLEILWISTDKLSFSRASQAISYYRVLVEQLEKVNVSKMDINAQIAFWINLYNSLVMHAYLAFGIPHNLLRRLALFHKAAYNVGGHIVSASSIEQSIFGVGTPRTGQWLETVLSVAMRKRSGEQRKLISSKYGLQRLQPLVCFALCTGAYSDPLLNVYTALDIKEELEAAKREFLQANIVFKKYKTIFLPELVQRYVKEAHVPSDETLIRWLTENVDKKLRDSIERCMKAKGKQRASQNIKWLSYDSTFRYMFAKDLTEKPW